MKNSPKKPKSSKPKKLQAPPAKPKKKPATATKIPAAKKAVLSGGKRVLVIDIGGSNIKLMMDTQPRVKIPSKPALTPRRLVAAVLAKTKTWQCDVISIGFPAPVEAGKIAAEPNNLGPGWVKFNLQKAFGKPVRLINDAAMQALGSYEGGRMLFIGLGTGLGSALIHHDTLIPLELCAARFSKQLTLEEVLGKRGYKRLGLVKWEQAVKEATGLLRRMFLVDYIVLGGGNVKKLAKLPAGTRPGNNNNAYAGGMRLWSGPIRAAKKP